MTGFANLREEMGMTTLEARCACGRLTVHCATEPAHVTACHCAACERRTGSAFGLAAWFAPEAVTPEGPSRTFTRKGDSGREITFHFCPDCGSNVYWITEAKPGRVAVAAGAFAGQHLPGPRREAYAELRKPWLHVDTEEGG
jgi:hypothetical protein